MANRNIHYEAAFEDYLRGKGWPYVAVDENKKAIFGNAGVKSFDFLVYSETGPNLLVDVKGRKFPDPTAGSKRSKSKRWENWLTRDDVEGLEKWQKVFGKDFLAMLVFAYWLQGPPRKSPFDDVHIFREKNYAFVGITLVQYLTQAKPRSAKWQTLSVPSALFSDKAEDLAAFL